MAQFFLECPNVECNCRDDAEALCVELECYKPGVYKCRFCKSEMINKNCEKSIDDLLFELAIKPSFNK